MYRRHKSFPTNIVVLLTDVISFGQRFKTLNANAVETVREINSSRFLKVTHQGMQINYFWWVISGFDNFYVSTAQ